MREFKIFCVVAVFTALVYWGVEPFAHSVMSPHLAPANFDFEAEDLSYAKSVVETRQNELNLAQNELSKAADKAAAQSKVKVAENALNSAKANLEANTALWARVKQIDFKSGNAAQGKEFFAAGGGMCSGCHGVKADGLAAPITDSAAGVTPPDLSLIGAFYDEKFLAALILNPALALKIDHKFPDGSFSVMLPYNADLSGDSEDVVSANIANLVAYFKEIAANHQKSVNSSLTSELQAKYAKLEGISEAEKAEFIAKDLAFENDKLVFVETCGRCHDMKYDKFTATSAKNDLKGYLGSVPPDLSMYIRSRTTEYLNNFINNTQKALSGTAMPRVGLTETAQKSVISYMEKVGDSKKDERQSLGLWIMGFFAFLSIFAILWKRKIWGELH